MSDDEQSPGGRSLRMGKKRDGPNWFMIAGGAVVMAVSVAFGRKKILNESEKAKERGSNGGARSQAASHDEDETGSVHMYETVHNGTPFWDKSESAAQSHAEFEFRSFKTKRPALNDPSPQVSKFCRQLSHNSVCQSNKDPVQSDSHTSTALRAGLTARREMIHRLRQQIRSRDAMIYDMQTQLADQEQMITMHRNHSADLQECVQAISGKLFEANVEVQRLHRELMAQRAQPTADLDDECIDIAVAEIKKKWVHPKDVEEIILEARRLNEEVERLEREKEVKDNLAQAKSRQCDLLSKKVSSLTTELKEVKTAAHGKQLLLEAKEKENLKLASVVQDLQHKLEIESRDNEWARSSKLSRRTDARNMNLSWKLNDNVDRPVNPPNHEEVSSACVRDCDDNYHQAGSLSLRKPYASVHARNDSQEDSEDSVAKAESRCLSDAHTKWCEAPEQDGKIDEGLILKFENEVDHVASGLSVTSKVVSEKMQAATRTLMKFQSLQEHSESRTDAQSNTKDINFSQVFSSMLEGISAERRQELWNELEQVAKQQDLEREMRVLTKHQTKLEELKYVVAKVSARFNAQNTDDTSNTDVLQLASSLFGIEQKLAVQEEIAKEASLFVQQLSTFFQVTSPQEPLVQDIWRTVKETSGNTTSSSSDENSRSALQSRAQENSSRILERQDSSSAPRLYFSPSRNNAQQPTSSSPVKLLDKPYQFQLGASDGPVSTSRTRSRNPLGAARTSWRKPATHHENMVGSKRHVESSEPNSRDRGSFRPESEVTSGFSFGLSARDRPLDNVGTSTSGNYHSQQTAESGLQQLEAIIETSSQPYAQEQGDRMSSPEPEPSTHIFRTSSPFKASEPSVSNPTYSKRFRTQNGSETLSPSNLNSMQSPAYDVSRYSPGSGRFGSPQSPCFGVTLDETNSRRPLFGKTSSPLAASSNSRLDSNAISTDLRKLNFAHSTDEDTDFQIKRSTEENSTRTSYNSNTDCSPRLRDVNSAHPSGAPVGVSPFAARMAYLDARQPGSPVGSLRNFEMRSERDHDFPCHEDEEDEEVSHHSVHSRVTNLVDDRQFHLFDRDLESKDSSGSCNPEEPLSFLPSLLRRSNSSNHRH